jgi:hypothetical protein
LQDYRSGSVFVAVITPSTLTLLCLDTAAASNRPVFRVDDKEMPRKTHRETQKRGCAKNLGEGGLDELRFCSETFGSRT